MNEPAGEVAAETTQPGRRRRWGVVLAGAVLLAGVVFSGVWIATFVPWAWESSGDRLPGVATDDPASCEHVLNNHGEYRCLTDDEHEREQLALQRDATGVVVGFFVVHCTVAAGEVLQRRQLADAAA